MKIIIPLNELTPEELHEFTEWLKRLPIKNPIKVTLTMEELRNLAIFLAEEA